MTAPRFEGRVIVVSGGASGIGLACVEGLVSEGAAVAVLDINDTARAALTSRFPPTRFAMHKTDVTSEAQTKAVVAAIHEQFGRIDGVINGAGIDLAVKFEDLTLEQWSQVLSVNVTGAMLLTHAAYPHLKQHGGTIVNLSSGAGLLPIDRRIAYSTSKAALQMFGKALALEAGRYGIRVNTVSPGAVDTPLFWKDTTTQAEREELLALASERYALKRIASPTEIADAVLWLTSHQSSFVTGTVVAVDGGRTYH